MRHPSGLPPDTGATMRRWYFGLVPLLLIAPLLHQPPESRPERAVSYVSAPMYAGVTVDDLTDAEITRQDAARAAEEARVAAEAQKAAEDAQRAARPVSAIPMTGTGAPHTDLWWSGVAMCEQGGQNHPYFGYFSFMDGSSGGKTWEEQVAMGNDLLIRAGREIGPWAESCVRAGYAASPNG